MPTILSRFLTILGTLLLSHACYSSWEHSKLNEIPLSTSHAPSTMPTAHSKSQLPLDISVETIISVILICIGLVSEAEELQPISWRIWAGNLEREGGGAGPFQGLEDRIGFIDIRAKRKEFADWVRTQGTAEKK